MKAWKLLGVYAVSFLVTAAFGKFFPNAMKNIIDIFFSEELGFSVNNHVRYRISLFLVGTVILIFLVPHIARYGIYGVPKFKAMRTPWWHAVLGFPLYSLMWIGYPFVALCSSCLASNDVFYFVSTIGIVIGFQAVIHAVILKIELLIRGER